MTYTGVIIEESLENKNVLGMIKVVSTRVRPVTDKHKTPWVTQWTLHTVEVPEEQADIVAEELSRDLDAQHAWYADFQNEKYHYIVYRGKIFKVDLSSPALYKDAKEYGMSLGIPEYQVNFVPTDAV